MTFDFVAPGEWEVIGIVTLLGVLVLLRSTGLAVNMAPGGFARTVEDRMRPSM